MCWPQAFSRLVNQPSPLATRLLDRVRKSILARFLIIFFLEHAVDSLRGRVFEVCLADLQNENHESAWRKIQLQIEEVKGFDAFTNFYGMDITRDKLCTLVKKWHTLIEAFVQAKTLDGYLVRMFCIAFTRRHKKQVRATCYAKNSQQKLIRQKMMDIMLNEITKNSLQATFKKLYVSSYSSKC